MWIFVLFPTLSFYASDFGPIDWMQNWDWLHHRVKYVNYSRVTRTHIVCRIRVFNQLSTQSTIRYLLREIIGILHRVIDPLWCSYITDLIWNTRSLSIALECNTPVFPFSVRKTQSDCSRNGGDHTKITYIGLAYLRSLALPLGRARNRTCALALAGSSDWSA